jgi:hypothetical protein
MANIPNADFSIEPRANGDFNVQPRTGFAPINRVTLNEGGILLNVGPRIGIGDHVNSVHHTLGVIERIAGFPWAYAYVPAQYGGAEPTVVVCLKRDRDFGVSPEMIRAVSLASSLLGQECIALWDPSEGRGQLIGPDADKWGAFDPAQFFDLDGRTLA